MAFLLLLHPALGHVLALLSVLSVTSLLVLGAADLRIFSGTLLGRLSVASLSWLIPTLLRVLGLALLVVLLMALLRKLIFKYCLRKIYWRRRKSSPAHAQCGTSACRSSRTVPHTPFYTGEIKHTLEQNWKKRIFKPECCIQWHRKCCTRSCTGSCTPPRKPYGKP